MSFDLSAARALDFSPVPDPRVAGAPLTLDQALQLVDRTFRIERLLDDSHSEIVASYYRQSLPGYSTIYNRWQCMHVPLQDASCEVVPVGEAAWFAQAEAVSELLAEAPSARVLELGSGLGANTLHLAARHPEADFTGLDLMAEHVVRAQAKAATLPNARFRQGSFEALPGDLGTFDVIFAVETLCYAHDLDRVARGIVGRLRPGGHLVIFDAQRREGFANFPAELVTAARLYEITTAVTRGFHPQGHWERALSAAGLNTAPGLDVTRLTQRGLATLHRRSLKAFSDRKWMLALRMMPRYLARNTVAGLLGYHVCFGAGARPDPTRGAVVYQKIVARKPV